MQSMEVLKKRTASSEMTVSMRVCHQAVAPEWTTTESPAKVKETLDNLLPLLNVQFVGRKTAYSYEVKLARTMYGVARSVKCEIELMSLKQCPFVTVVRLCQKVKLKPEMDSVEKESRLAQYNFFCQQLKHGLGLADPE